MTAELDTPLESGWAVILAGGVGSRFWPASTPERPKQLLPLGSDRPLIADTVERADRLVGLDRVRIVAGTHLVGPIREACPELRPEHFFVEPEARGTGPALAWAAWRLQRRDPDAVMLSLHADHMIRPYGRFRESASRALEAAADDGRLYCLGKRPTRPEVGYGYLHLGDRLDESRWEVREFVEKPDRGTARSYLESGEYFWNTGIFAWRCGSLLEEASERSPEMGPALERLRDEDSPGFFGEVEPISVDEGVLERSDRVGCVEAAFEWDDVGTWTALARTRGSDEAGNTAVGPARLVESRDNVVWAEGGEVTLFDVSDLVVVRSGGHTLVTTRSSAPRLKELLAERERTEASSGDPEPEARTAGAGDRSGADRGEEGR